MAALIRIVANFYKDFSADNFDKRTENYFLASSIFYPLGIITLYLYLVLKFLPNFMKNRPPYNVDKIVQIYNIAQIVSNAWIFKVTLVNIWIGANYQFVCQPVDRSYNELAIKITHYGWWFYVLKISDLLDTIFFLLRKKDKQVTFLHVYHHAIMVFAIWLGLRHSPGGHGVLLAVINSFVHVVMYFYYFLTNVNADYKKSIGWKKHVTQLQLVQFLILFIQNLLGIIKTDCQYPRIWIFLLFVQDIFMVFMFYDFYRRTYRKKKNE